jgi:hypothetical protein
VIVYSAIALPFVASISPEIQIIPIPDPPLFYIIMDGDSVVSAFASAN